MAWSLQTLRSSFSKLCLKVILVRPLPLPQAGRSALSRVLRVEGSLQFEAKVRRVSSNAVPSPAALNGCSLANQCCSYLRRCPYQRFPCLCTMGHYLHANVRLEFSPSTYILKSVQILVSSQVGLALFLFCRLFNANMRTSATQRMHPSTN
jgi:hypothetical protein